MRFQRVLITGCGGMLGNAVYPFFKERFPNVLATDKRLTEPWIAPLDVCDDRRLREVFDDYEPDLVLHLAAETDVEVCENDPDHSYATNTRATRVIAELCRNRRAAMVFISTAAVFNGKKGSPSTEEDWPSPIMSYGHHKLEAEHYVRSICPEYYMFRAGWMMGGGWKHDKKFVSKILRQIAAGKPILHVVTDKHGTPGYTYDFAKGIYRVVESGRCDTYHQVCSETTRRFDVAAEILTILNRPDIELVPVSSDFFKDEYFCPRPESEAMVNANLNKTGMNVMRTWKVSLREYIHNHFAELIRTDEAFVSGEATH